MLLDYSALIGFVGEQVRVTGGLTGRFLVTTEPYEDPLGERTWHQFGLATNLELGNIRPGVHLRIPLDKDLKDNIDFVWGFNVSIQLK